MKKKRKLPLFTLAVVMVMMFAMHITAFAAEGVTGVRQVNDSDTSVRIGWDKVTGARYYGIQWSTDPGFSAITGQMDGISGTYCDIEDLAAASVYYVRVGYGTERSDCFQNFSAPVEVVTAPAKPEVSFVDVDEKTVTISWPAVEGATSYTVTYADQEFQTTDTRMQLTYVKEKSTADVCSTKTSAAGYAAESAKSKVENLITLTKKIKKGNFTVTDWVPAINFRVSNVYGENVEFEFYNLKTKKKKIETASVGRNSVQTVFKSLKEGYSYKYRVRASVTLTDGTKKRGTWSDYRYLANSKAITLCYSKANMNTRTIEWKKIAGVTQIKVEFSHKRDSGYKKVATLKGTKTSYTFKKLNLNKGNYVKLTYYVKVGKKTYKANVAIRDLND